METGKNSNNRFGIVARPYATATNISLLVILLAGAYRLFTLDVESLWLDELYSINTADPDRPLSEVFEKIKPDVHPPLYLFFLHYWMKLFGTSEIAARLPSLIAIIASALFALWYFRPIVGPRASGIFGILLTISYGPAWYAQEVRSYALMILFSVVLTGASLKIIENNKTGHPEPKTLWLFALCATILSYLHYFGFILYCSAAAAILLFTFRRFDLLWRMAPYIVLPAVPALLWTYYHYSRISPNILDSFWITSPATGDFLSFLGLLFGISYISLAAAPVMAFAVIRREGPIRRIALFALYTVSIGTALALAISMLHPVITARNLLVFLPAIHLLTAASLAWLLERPSLNPGRFWPVAKKGIAILIIVTIASVSHLIVLGRHKTDWRKSAADILALEACRKSTIFVMGGYDLGNYHYYTTNRHEDAAIRFIDVSRKKTVTEGDITEVLTDPCPVILWGIESSGYSREWAQNQVLDHVEADFEEVRYEGAILIVLRPPTGKPSTMQDSSPSNY